MRVNSRFAVIIRMLFVGLTIGNARATAKPNLVIMLANNLGYGDLSSYNSGTRGGMRTPNIDGLAAQGMRFTQFLVEPGCTHRNLRRCCAWRK